MTPTLEQKIKDDFEEKFGIKVTNEIFHPYVNKRPATLWGGFHAAALPLHQEIAELKEALDWVTSNWGTIHMDYQGARDKCDKIRQKFKLDDKEVKK